ncbi:MAG TPA: M48 family metallopeptidase [Pseudonocardiaceae bacterium]|jgi:Zn-dependent protease with chaperone function|nr:M48 family metallopeptidase [Pseudonocardiaceae bacterium]
MEPPREPADLVGEPRPEQSNDETSTGTVAVGPGRIRFPGISPRAYEHPADRGALATLRTVSGFGTVLKAVSGAFAERGERLSFLASSVRVGPKQYPGLDQLRAEAVAILDLDRVPEMFVYRDPQPNSMAIGLDQPFIVISTGLIELLDTNALRFVIGHEVGHVLSGHALYRTMLLRLLQLSQNLQWLPIGYWGLRAVIFALKEWFRKAELSADRAGLLCVQDPNSALRAHILMAGATGPADVNTAEFLRQARDYEGDGDVRDSVLKLLNVLNLTHPLAVVRAAELQKWGASEDYRAILAGQYDRRTEEPHTTWTDDLKSAARSYRDSFTESTDPLTKVVGDVGGVISGAAKGVWQKFTPGQDEPADAAAGAGESTG